MEIFLSKEQSIELSKFFFDIAKGIFLGGIGFAVVAPIEIKITVSLISTFCTYVFVRIALRLLRE